MKKIWTLLLLIGSLFLFAACQDFFSYNIEQYQFIESLSLYQDNHQLDDIDVEDLVNNISLNIMQSNVTVYTTTYAPFLFMRTKEESFYGSGIIFYENEDFYYVLTNEHVVSLTRNSTSATYEIIDYQNNKYKGFLYENASSIAYDLAILFFEKNEKSYEIIKINDRPLDIGDKVIAIGNPKSQKNMITMGEVLEFSETNVKNRYGDVVSRDFLAIKHSAYVNSGSSGGMLLNYQLQLVGINFAGADDDGRHVYTFSIPVNIIVEYFNNLLQIQSDT